MTLDDNQMKVLYEFLGKARFMNSPTLDWVLRENAFEESRIYIRSSGPLRIEMFLAYKVSVVVIGKIDQTIMPRKDISKMSKKIRTIFGCDSMSLNADQRGQILSWIYLNKI